ncbi:MAG: Mrp/NBP35 family ATP-binding protein [Desulfomonilaceae bacterium]|nr:Mrp/NBP35 family ATP-binding protein [Desulfomonilaceae bacterium]
MSQSLNDSEEMSLRTYAPVVSSRARACSDGFDRRLHRRLSMIRHKVAVMSGKGGVGKSTVVVDLAVALALRGKKVGVLDGDIHGPNVPFLFGLQGQRPTSGPDGLMPLTAHQNIKVMSIAFLLDGRDTPVAWRGPLKHSLFEQFFADVDWGELDYLLIDLPPGTGDEPLSVAQLLGKPLWTVIVTTPQDVAVLDSRKAAVFGKSVDMGVLGIVENMSGFSCPHCGAHMDVFKAGGGKKASSELGVPFLGRIPFDPIVVRVGDQGIPIVLKHPHSKVSKAFSKVAVRVDEAIADLTEVGLPERLP